MVVVVVVALVLVVVGVVSVVVVVVVVVVVLIRCIIQRHRSWVSLIGFQCMLHGRPRSWVSLIGFQCMLSVKPTNLKRLVTTCSDSAQRSSVQATIISSAQATQISSVQATARPQQACLPFFFKNAGLHRIGFVGGCFKAFAHCRF